MGRIRQRTGIWTHVPDTDSTTTTLRRSYLDAMPNHGPRRSSSFARVREIVNHIADAGAVSRTVTSKEPQCNIMFPYVLDIYLEI